jgi:hypothetical protein
MLSEKILKEMQDKIGRKHNVILKQTGYGGSAQLIIEG